MEPHTNLDRSSAASGAKAVVGVALSGALPPLPIADGGHSLAEMAQRDLDAALQLLADRAQYITGASGAAIALRRDGKKDMLCRASTGANAPELGALLSTEFGLSGESVRTRQPLRCDDAERDLRVNRDVCREMGIASVVVMPVVNDDEVLGVFELFSGKANAFGARDLSAVQRLSEMVETAVRLAQATERLPERLQMPEALAPEIKPLEVAELQAPDTGAAQVQAVEAPVIEAQAPDNFPVDGEILAGQLLADIVLEDPTLEDAALHEEVLEVATDRAESPIVNASAAEGQTDQKGSIAPAAAATSTTPAADPAAPRKTLFWSAAMNPVADAGTAVEPDQSHVPPMLRSLRKCEACGFPVSAGRALCVECEEKKWRGQLRVPRAGAPRPPAMPAVKSVESAKPEARAFAAAAQTTAVAKTTASSLSAAVTVAAPSGTVTAPPARKDDQAISATTAPAAAAREIKTAPTAPTSSTTSSAFAPSSPVQPSSTQPAKAATAEFVFSAGLAPSQSWFATYKYILGVLLVVGGAVAAFFLLR